ncbi:MAG: type III-B CRISPR-associated protein Cas10/Cmr2 [Anaerolineae bacterium CG03_land_8_20_14_0_80_58_20]|nr:MAG: type III-B CRISPR-associated protein Cas10/Cmr2 [Anaerolineae bacterium CG03_land_8_20_14_0_80_58_20]
MKHLMIFAVGPVQDFIATARRSRDLWYGSWMLSELSKAAAAQFPPEALIFPSPTGPQALKPGSDFNVPNKIVAILDHNPSSTGEEIRSAILKRLGELWEDAHGKIEGKIKEKLAKDQITDLPEFYWVSVSYDDAAGGSYAKARATAEALLAARKTTRDFKQAIGDHSPKSSLDGARESVIEESEYPRPGAAERVERAKKLYRNYHARQGERLSAVDLLKRLGGGQHVEKFKSTSHMAALPFLKKLGPERTKALMADLRALFDKPDWKDMNIGETDDGALLFESRLVEGIPSGPEQDALRKEFNQVLEKHLKTDRPDPYYALLAADGDNMGVVIDAQADAAKHRALSQAMSRFAAEVQGIVERNNGVPIYSGGDDVLAYLPLHTVLNCAAELEQAFKKHLPEKDFSAQKNGETVSPTLSIGIVIAHHLEPLADVLELAREAEKEAKKVDPIKKNGLAVTLRKRGGADRTVSGQWGILDARLETLIRVYSTKAISAGTAYELQELHRVLSKAGVPANGQAKEAVRIVKRKKKSGGEVKVKQKTLDAFEQWIAKDILPLDELSKEMIIAGMFAGASGTGESKEEEVAQ